MMVMAMNLFSEHGNIGNVSPKEEHDDEIETMAKRIKLTNDKKMALMKPVVWNIGQSTNRNATQNIENLPPDWSSVQGQFGWTRIGTVEVPYIFRHGQKYVAERVMNVKLFKNYQNVFSKEVYCYSIEKVQITTAEIKLLNEINSLHCDSEYGTLGFSKQDSIILLEDAKEIYAFLKFCYDVLVNGSPPKDRKCGFIKIIEQSNVHHVPYILWNSKHYVPLFYLDGTSLDRLEKEAIQISGWDLSYLKIACKVHGIESRHYEKSQLQVVELELVKKFFYSYTVFEECWLTNGSVHNLIKSIAKTTQQPIQQQASSGSLPAVASSPVYSTTNHYQHQPLDPSRTQTILGAMATQIQRDSYTNTNSNQTFPSELQAHLQNCSVPYPVNSNNYPTTTATTTVPPYQNSYSFTAGNPQISRGPPPPYPNNTRNGNIPVYHNNVSQNTPLPHTSNSNYSSVRNIPQTPNPHYMTNSAPNCVLSVPLTANSNGPNVVLLKDVPFRGRQYKLQTMRVEDKLMYTCINMNANEHQILIVTLEEVVSAFDVSINDFLIVLSALRIDVYYPNKQMMKVFSSAGVSYNKGLIRIDALIKHLPQIRYLLRRSSTT